MKAISFLPLLSSIVSVEAMVAWVPPSYGGFSVRWQDSFGGSAGAAPDERNWNIIEGNPNKNGEVEVYSRSNRNLQLSGGNSVQLVPWREGNGWTSASLESKYTFTPEAGRVTLAEALIRFGPNDVNRKKGIWPAFWLLGDSIRHGTGWPACGEVDIMESINGQLTGYGTLHCDHTGGGACQEPVGLQGRIGMPNQDWHTWRVQFDRTSDDWRRQTITWFMDGNQFHQVSGDRVGNEAAWKAMCQSPLFFILNVAVGGEWPGYPDENTQDGYGSMMEVAYVAHYVN